jgi:hypothetical protein
VPITLLLILGCRSSDPSLSEADTAFCDAVDTGRVLALLGGTKNTARLAREHADQREYLCNSLRGHLNATASYLEGFTTGISASASGLHRHVIVHSGNLIANRTEAKMLCRSEEWDTLAALLNKLEREIEDDFAKQLAVCREHGWKPKGND